MLKYVHIFIMLNLLRNHDSALHRQRKGGPEDIMAFGWLVDSTNEIRLTTVPKPQWNLMKTVKNF